MNIYKQWKRCLMAKKELPTNVELAAERMSWTCTTDFVRC